MSSTLVSVFSVEPEQEPAYWWPLLFEAMRRIGFSYDNPLYLPERRGKYHAWPLEDTRFSTDSGVSFRDAWNAAYSESDVVTIEFWSHDKNPYWLEGTVSHQNTGLTELMLGFPAESLADDNAGNLPIKIIEYRLRRWLDGVREVSELCTPTKADVVWERWGELYRVGIIDQPLSAPASGSVEVFNATFPHSHPVEHALTGHTVMTLLDPLPIPWRGGWESVSLP